MQCSTGSSLVPGLLLAIAPAFLALAMALGEDEPQAGKQQPQAEWQEEKSETSSLVVEVDEADPVGVYFYCQVCNRRLNGPRQWEDHVSGKKHQKKFRRAH